ncbi:MAG TPA: serine/threonine-protein kinase [Polyangiaceae bacterium]|nr:serine/threonine-protein kinase [Polyangiaceae bacterium]
MSAPALTAGTVLAGKYRIDRVLGEGGMGIVVAATDLALERKVAIKFLLPDFAQHQEASQRFLREARAAVKIQSDHVARVIDVGTLDGGAPYMVMEYLEGRDLSAVIAEHRRLPVEEAVAHVLEACDAIAEAHSVGIVHRDLKPANLFLTRQPDGSSRVKVLDFGISKAMVADSDHSLTRTSTMMGSPLYMSPEQMKSAKNVDPRTDVWALGVILYELLTGEPPFNAESIPELSAKVLLEQPASVRAARTDVPPALEAAVLRALEKDPAKRFATVADFAVALVSFGPARTRINVERASRVLRLPSPASAAVTQPMADAPVASVSAPSYARTEAAWADTAGVKREKSRTPAVVGGVAAVLVAGAGLLVWRGATHAGTPVAPSAAPVAPATRTTPAAQSAPAARAAEMVTANEAPSATAEPSVVPTSAGAQASKPVPSVARPRPSKKPKNEPAPSVAPVDPTSGFGSRK